MYCRARKTATLTSIQHTVPLVSEIDAKKWWGGALCVQMDFTRTFEANTKCNNINYV